jgi:fibro-slime domain-containing protein
VGVLTLASCGRTSFVRYECYPFGERRPCSDACGSGQQTCVAGRWAACDAEAERPCAAACGLAAERCTGGAWQGCIPRAERPCHLACDAVAELCLDGVWQGCPSTVVRACSTPCGDGQQTCQGGAWAPCDATGSRACQTPCGDGQQTCQAGAWATCDATGSRACQTVCGDGQQTCQAGAWATCDATGSRACQTVCGTGLERCQGATWQACDAPQPQPPPGAIALRGTVRDFHDTHPDFERPPSGVGDDPGLVQPLLGADRVPVYAHDGGTLTVTSPESFFQWFHDTPGVNLAAPLDLTLVETSTTPLVYTLDQPLFFPIDGQLFGNEGRPHDYHFTLELHATLEYRGGEVLRFRGDDDIWVFVDRRLVIDLGGPHQAESGEVFLDRLGLNPMSLVPLDVFFAERHTTESSLRIETTGTHLTPCP